MDPTKIGEALGQAQDIQTVLGIFIGCLLVAIAFLVKVWLHDRLAHAQGIKTLEVAQAIEVGRLTTEAQTKRADWHKLRAEHAESIQQLHLGHAEKVEQLMREMTDLALGVERALDQLHRRTNPSDAGPIGG